MAASGFFWRFFGGPGSWTYGLLDQLRRRLNRHLVGYLCGRAVREDDSMVLEAGSGPAFASCLFAAQKKVRLSVAADIDIEALLEARRPAPSLPLVVADLYNLPFRPGTFHLVWNSSTLEHLSEPRRALGEMARVTREGGYVFVGVPYRFGVLAFQPLIKRTKFGVWLGPLFDRSQLTRMMLTEGLAPGEAITYFFRCFIGLLAQKQLRSAGAVLGA